MSRDTVFDLHVAVKWGNILLSSVICDDDTLGIVRRTQDAQCPVGVSCDRMAVDYTHDEYCNMPLTLSKVKLSLFVIN
jgi:hypothetical protein